MKRWNIGFVLVLIIVNISVSQSQNYLERQEDWVKSTIDKMTLDQKLGQLFMVRAFSKGDAYEQKVIDNLIDKYFIGGVCFFQGSPERQLNLVNHYQNKSKLPLFVAIDGEWGLNMRYPGQAVSFPRQIMLGAIQDEKLIYDMGREIGKQCKSLGININFAPIVDVNSNPKNPIINERSFGESKENVTSKSYLYIKGLEDEGVMACAKHFPGHGDTEVDSHHDLPIILNSKERLEQVEFYPFRKLASQNLGSIMVGHLSIPALDDRANRPSSLSKKIVTDILREQMGFKGLIFTDALDMKSITKNFPRGIAEAEALLAGNDVLLLSENVGLAIETIKKYLAEGLLDEAQINLSVTRILRAKYKLGLQTKPTPLSHEVKGILKNPNAYALKSKLIENSLTLVIDKNDWIPYKRTDLKTVTLSVNVINKSNFQIRIDDYTDARHYQLMTNTLSTRKQSLKNTLLQFDRIIIAIHSSVKNKNINRDLPNDLVLFLEEINKEKPVTLCLFGNPYMLSKLNAFEHVLVCYDNEGSIQDIAAQTLFGANNISGKLSVGVSPQFKLGQGLDKASLNRLGYARPEYVGMSSDTLNKIDKIMAEMIALKAAPGGQVLIAKDGKIVFQREYGKLTYTGDLVKNNTIYDMASVTKIIASTISIMKLHDEGKIDIKKPISRYIDELRNTDKSNLIIEDILAHHAGLKAYIPFYESTILKNKNIKSLNPAVYSHILKDDFNIPVAERMFMRADYRDSIWTKIYQSEIKNNSGYKYSDLGFFMMQKAIENTSNKKLDEYVATNFFGPLGLKYTGYKPLATIPISQIAPSEEDNYFRMKTVTGTVHDMAAAMMGGVAGHAGVFSTAKETAIIMQMLLNKGSYGGVSYLKPETVELFTKRHSQSTRRGLGFDLKELNKKNSSNMSELAPNETYGHLGFTGTATYVDPINNIVFVFCSNRTYPTMNNNTLHNKKIRPKVQSLIYKSLVTKA